MGRNNVGWLGFKINYKRTFVKTKRSIFNLTKNTHFLFLQIIFEWFILMLEPE